MMRHACYSMRSGEKLARDNFFARVSGRRVTGRARSAERDGAPPILVRSLNHSYSDVR
jgi:hypothetical protein